MCIEKTLKSSLVINICDRKLVNEKFLLLIECRKHKVNRGAGTKHGEKTFVELKANFLSTILPAYST